jgi:hypothetical protein
VPGALSLSLSLSRSARTLGYLSFLDALSLVAARKEVGSDAQVANRDTTVWHGATENFLERWTNPKPLGTIVDRAAILLCAAVFCP